MRTNKIFNILAICVTILVYACSGEDRTYEYERLTEHNHWIYEQMTDNYLWADTLTEPAWKKFFGDASTFFSTLTQKAGDNWSYVMVDTVTSDPHERGNFNHNDSYGMDFKLMTDPTGQTTKQYVRVLTVYPGSPAEKCGLQRGDFITSYDGYKFSSSNISKLQKGIARTLTVCHLSVDTVSETYSWTDTLTLQLPASTYVEDEAYPAYGVFNVAGISTGYLMCTRLTEGAYEQNNRNGDTRYRSELDAIMQEMKSSEVAELVLDLRLCNYGTMDMAQRMASYIVAPQYLGSTFVKTQWSAAHADKDAVIPFDSSVGNLGLGRVYVITSGYTQGAAEWLIHSLRTTMGADNVIVIGEKTAGQNVMTQQVRSDTYQLSIYPAVAYVNDAEGSHDYASGITPDYAVNEYNYVTLAPYGTLSETLLYYAFMLIARG